MKTKGRNAVCILCAGLALAACRNGETVPDCAGDNRAELEKVLAHYKSDPLKPEAARFLIENMDAHYYYGGETVDAYYRSMDSLFRQPGRRPRILEPAIRQHHQAVWGRLGRRHGPKEVRRRAPEGRVPHSRHRQHLQRVAAQLEQAVRLRRVLPLRASLPRGGRTAQPLAGRAGHAPWRGGRL